MKRKIILTLIALIGLSLFKMYGQQWINVTPANYETYAGFFIDSKKGWINAKTESNNYTLLYTNNGAESFESIYNFPQTGIGFSRIQMVDSLIGYGTVSGIDTFFYKTTNGGYNWTNITDTSIMKPGSLCVFFFVNPDTGFCGGSNSIYKTINGGDLWSKMITPDPEPYTLDNYVANEIYFHDALHGWAACSHACDGGFGMKTIDGGESWEICTSTFLSNQWDVHFIDNLKGGMAGYSWGDVVVLTEDNFNSLSYSPFLNIGVNTIAYQNDSIIWMGGEAILSRSIDSGETFTDYQTIEIPGVAPYIRDIQFFGNIGYAFGNRFLLKFESLTGSISPDTDSGKEHFKIWPTPTIDNMNIQIKCSKPDEVTVTLYSLEGKPVRKIKSFLSTGINYITLNAEKVTAGVYLLAIEGKSVLKHQIIIKQ